MLFISLGFSSIFLRTLPFIPVVRSVLRFLGFLRFPLLVPRSPVTSVIEGSGSAIG